MTTEAVHLAGSGVKLTNKLTYCEDRQCPAVWETDDPDVFAVQGTLVQLDDLPEGTPMHEDVVLIPRDVLIAGATAAMLREIATLRMEPADG